MDSFGCHTRTKGYDDSSISVGVTLGVLLSVVSDLLTTNMTTSCLLNEVSSMIGEILQKSHSDVVCLTQRDQVLPENDTGEIHLLVGQKTLQLSHVTLVQGLFHCPGRCVRGGRNTSCPQTIQSTLVLIYVQVFTFSTL